MKKKLTAIALTLTILLALTACGGGGGGGASSSTAATSADESKSTPAESGKKTVLTVEAVAGSYAEVIQEYCDQAFLDEIGVELVFNMSGTVDSYAKQMMEFSQGASTYDIVLLEPAWLGDYAAHLEPIEPLMEKTGTDLYLDDIMTKYKDIYCSWEGTMYTIPFDGDQFNLFYNTTAFDSEDNKSAFQAEYGYALAPPKTWDEYADMAIFFNGRDWDGDGQPDYGTSEAWGSGGYAYWWWMARFAAYGGLYFDEDMNPLINAENGMLAMENMLRIANAVPPGTVSAGYTECEAAFVNGDAAMSFCWNSVGKTAMNPDASQIVGKVGIALLPGAEVNGKLVQRPTLPTGWSAGIPKYISDERKELAMKVIEKFSDPNVAKNAALYHPACVDAWRISTFEAPEWATLYEKEGAAQFGFDMISVMNETVEKGLVDLQIPGTDEYIQALDKEISAAVSGNKTGEQALNDAAAEWNAITERRGRDTQKAAWNAQYELIRQSGIDYIAVS